MEAIVVKSDQLNLPVALLKGLPCYPGSVHPSVLAVFVSIGVSAFIF